ncbi:NACHT domain-containing protein [Phormidesmis priestleyi ULC007]|uniref:NACHT domain-containing protein n=2 Tax=Phormidesmis priestleyi TaxID=268141 RepID=A0A2T1DN51_9CYAN|nr:NACHT domain-containing protein [Phormidesmis priestleyi ULC007]PZO55101.1 MAG: NACHT domain-containing protein [Phormidesmis priestleyi]
MVFATKIDLAAELEISRATVQNFFAGKAIGRENFHKICHTLKLPWHEIADLNDDPELAPEDFERAINDDCDSAFYSHDINLDRFLLPPVQPNLIQELRQQIRVNIQQQCGSLRVLDMSQPRQLDHLYTEVKVLEKISSRRRLSVSDLLRECVKIDDRPYLKNTALERSPGLSAVEQHSKLIILGKPGAGKTTFLKHLAMQCITGTFLSDRVPIFISLKDVAEDAYPVSLLTHITQQFAATTQLVSEALTQGKALILLDGLDEVKEHDRPLVLQAIRQFSAQFHANHFVITCRIAAQDYVFEQFTEVEIADFDDSQIANFAQKWFTNDATLPIEFLHTLFANPPIHELATSPILLTLLCLIFEDSRTFPVHRSTLYQEALQLLMKTWDASRHLDRASAGKMLSLHHKEELLSRIALLRFEQGDYFFRQQELEQSIWDYRRTVAQTAIASDDLDLDSEAILKSFEADQGLLVEQARGIYSFSHYTFQEYFAARAIAHPALGSALEMPLQKLVNQIIDPRWHPVFLITIDLLPDPDCLLQLMKQKIDHLAQDANLSPFLTWLTQKTAAMSTPNNAAAMRAFYLELELGHLLDPVQGSCLLSHSLDADGSIAAVLKTNGDLALDVRLARLLTLAIAPHFEREPGSFTLSRSQSLVQALTTAFESAQSLDPDLAADLHILQSQWSDLAQMSDEEIRFQADWKTARSTWVAQLRLVLDRHRNLGHVWSFNLHEKRLLKQYYCANQLLLECLGKSGSATQRLMQKSLLSLPIVELNTPVTVARSMTLPDGSVPLVPSIKSDTK